jgi:hypothetical protein
LRGAPGLTPPDDGDPDGLRYCYVNADEDGAASSASDASAVVSSLVSGFAENTWSGAADWTGFRARLEQHERLPASIEVTLRPVERLTS